MGEKQAKKEAQEADAGLKKVQKEKEAATKQAAEAQTKLNTEEKKEEKATTSAVFNTEVSMSISGMKAADFDTKTKGALKQAISAATGVDASSVTIASTSEEEELGESASAVATTVRFEVQSATQVAAGKAKAAVEAKAKDTGATGLMKTFEAQAAAVGKTIPKDAGITTVTATVVQKGAKGSIIPIDADTEAAKAAKEMNNAVQVKAAIDLLKKAEADKAKLEARAAKLEKPYRTAQKQEKNDIHLEKTDKLTLEHAKADSAKAAAKTRAMNTEKSVQLSNLNAATGVLQKAKDGAGAAKAWAFYLKKFADQKSEDAKTPKPT